MEWIILVVLVPAVIVPVVLLFGLAGCALLLGIETISIKPVALGESGIPPTKTETPISHTFYPFWDASVVPGTPISQGGACLVQRFEIGLESPGVPWSVTASHWIVTIRNASATENLIINEATVSLGKSGKGQEPWDSIQDLANPLASIIHAGVLGNTVTVLGNAVVDSLGRVTVPAGASGVLWMEYAGVGVTLPVNQGNFLLVAFDIVSGEIPHGGGLVGNRGLSFFKTGYDAMNANRTFDLTDPTAIKQGVSLIERITFIETKVSP